MYNLNHGQVPLKSALGKKLNLFAEILYTSFFREHHQSWVEKIPEYVKKYGFNQLNIHQAAKMKEFCCHFPNFPLMNKELSLETRNEITYFRGYLQQYKKLGLRLTCGFCGSDIPADLLEKYPEAADVTNGLFCQFIEDMVVNYFELFPECNCLELYLWENAYSSDNNHVFEPLSWRNYPYYSASDILADVLTAYCKGAQKAGKEFALLTFSHFPWQEKILIDALHHMDMSVPIILDHKCQSGDWDLHRPVNNVLEQCSNRPAYMLFDGTGEYWGQCRIPFCMPENIQNRLQHALNYNSQITDVGMRVMWDHGSTFENYNDINFYALSRFAADPWMPVEQVWNDWATERFGKKAAPLMIRALTRTYEIAKRIFYVLGMWANNHTHLPSLAYMTSHLVNFGRALYEWTPMDYNYEALYHQFMTRPREYTIQKAITESEEALEMVRASLHDVEEVLPYLCETEAKKIKYQMELLYDYAAVMRNFHEAFMRYWVNLKNQAEADPNNMLNLDATLRRLQSQAIEITEKYGENEPILRGALITRFINDITAAIN